jgi:hypothetical protein
VRRLPRYAVAILRQYRRHPATRDEAAHMVQPGSLQGRPAVATIHYLFQDLVAITGGVLAQSLHLLGEGVPVARLPLCRDAGVENDPAAGVICGTVQHLLPSFCSCSNAMAFPAPPQLGARHPSTTRQASRRRVRLVHPSSVAAPALALLVDWSTCHALGCSTIVESLLRSKSGRWLTYNNARRPRSCSAGTCRRLGECAQQAHCTWRDASEIETSTCASASMPAAWVMSARQARTLDWFRPRWLLSSVVQASGCCSTAGATSRPL